MFLTTGGDFADFIAEISVPKSTTPIRRLLALTSFGVWLSMLRAGLGPEERVDLLARVLACAMRP